MEIQSSGRPIEVVMEKVLSMNIVSSDYFKELYKIKTYHEVIDDIYNQVDHVEPWMTGNCRGPSTAFCLLYKLFTMKLTMNQMHGLLKHPDSPYIRDVSRDFLRGRCDRKSCRYSHVIAQPDHEEHVKREPYRFAHPDPLSEVSNDKFEICRDFKRGECTRPTCRFYHPSSS